MTMKQLGKKKILLRLHCRKFKLQTQRIPFHFLYNFKSVIHSFDPLIGCYILYSGFRFICTQLEIDDLVSQEVWKMTLSKEFGWIFTSWLAGGDVAKKASRHHLVGLWLFWFFDSQTTHRLNFAIMRFADRWVYLVFYWIVDVAWLTRDFNIKLFEFFINFNNAFFA